MIYDGYDPHDLKAKIKEAERKMRRQERAALKTEGEAKTEAVYFRITPTVQAMVDMLTVQESKTELLTRLIEQEYHRRYPPTPHEQPATTVLDP